MKKFLMVLVAVSALFLFNNTAKAESTIHEYLIDVDYLMYKIEKDLKPCEDFYKNAMFKSVGRKKGCNEKDLIKLNERIGTVMEAASRVMNTLEYKNKSTENYKHEKKWAKIIYEETFSKARELSKKITRMQKKIEAGKR